jgi:serine/threonine protein kinase/tetratricopeptide (TPR) repeat protein
MTPERWERIKEVLGAALELPADQRPVYLDQQCAGDVALRSEIELLLRSEQSIESQFLGDNCLAEVAAALIPTEENPWIGRRVGAYQIVEQIGTGGMGEVYRAFRADDQYRKDVALKVIRAGQDSGSVITRFKNERQILASLEHPNIARLLDGGTTEEGVPFFAMELIDGRPITEYCDLHRLSIAARLRLFLQVCGAVQYAHQHLIIHRDIKPGNILVTADGTPKLLDFGIAKILDIGAEDGLADSTMTAFRVLTPRYSSPEQIHGDSMTTASDVYSLGVVLYELLTGLGPYRLSTGSSQEIVQAVCNTEPQKPSLAVCRLDYSKESGDRLLVLEERSELRGSSPEKLRKRISGDLDNIVLMALEKNPAHRYRSVEQLQEDIRRHLEDVPIFARNGTAWYRASKFVTRHKAGVAFTGTFAFALLTGMAITLHEVRVARMERTRAEMRFNDVRKLANSLMFEIHDSIKDLAGATPARKLLVERAQEYLDSLSKEASGDLSLQRELAAAYDRVGDLLGYSGAANLGDSVGALQSYKKALAIRTAAAAANPNDAAIQSDLVDDYFRLSFVLLDAGDYPGALNELQMGLPIAQKLAATKPDPRYQDYLAGFYWQTGSVQNQAGDYAHAAENFRQAVSIRAPAAKTNLILRTHLGGDYIGLATALQQTGEINSALEAAKQGLQLTQELSLSNPTNATFREYLGESYNLSAPLLEKKGNINLALEYYRDANEIFSKLRAADPSNSLARVNFGSSDLGIARELMLKGKVQQAIPRIREAIATFETIEQKNRYYTEGQAESYETLGMAFEALANGEPSRSRKAKDLHESRIWLQKSLTTWEQGTNQGPRDPAAGPESKRVQLELANCESVLAKT